MRPKSAGVLTDIRDAARSIAEDTDGHTFDSFRADRRVRPLVERNREIIGDAVRRLGREDPPLAERVTGHRRIIGMRNALIHGYDAINHAAVWLTVQESLPLLRAEVDLPLREADDPSPAPDARRSGRTRGRHRRPASPRWGASGAPRRRPRGSPSSTIRRGAFGVARPPFATVSPRPSAPFVADRAIPPPPSIHAGDTPTATPTRPRALRRTRRHPRRVPLPPLRPPSPALPTPPRARHPLPSQPQGTAPLYSPTPHPLRRPPVRQPAVPPPALPNPSPLLLPPTPSPFSGLRYCSPGF